MAVIHSRCPRCHQMRPLVACFVPAPNSTLARPAFLCVKCAFAIDRLVQKPQQVTK